MPTTLHECYDTLYDEELLDNNIFTNTDPELAAIGREQRLANEYDLNELYQDVPNCIRKFRQMVGVMPGKYRRA